MAPFRRSCPPLEGFHPELPSRALKPEGFSPDQPWRRALERQLPLSARRDRGADSEMDVGRGRRLAAGGRTNEETDLEQEGLDHLRQGLGLVIDGRRDGLEPDGAAAVLLDDGAEEAAVEPVAAGTG